MLQMLRESGAAGYVLVFLGLVGLAVGSLSCALAFWRRPAALALGLAALGLASASAGLGRAATAKQRADIERVLALDAVEPSVVGRIRHVGYRESRSTSALGLGAALVPLVGGAIATWVAARSRRRVVLDPVDPAVGYRGAVPRERSPTPRSVYVAAVALAVALATAASAAAVVVAPVPTAALTPDDAARVLKPVEEAFRSGKQGAESGCFLLLKAVMNTERDAQLLKLGRVRILGCIETECGEHATVGPADIDVCSMFKSYGRP